MPYNYCVVTLNDEVLHDDLTLDEAEHSLCCHLHHGYDAYLGESHYYVPETNMKTVEIDRELLQKCLDAFNELPNKHLKSGITTYSLASALTKVLKESVSN